MARERPPAGARWLLTRLLPAELREPFLGDLAERHAAERAARGAWRAGLWYWSELLRSHPLRLRRSVRQAEPMRRRGTPRKTRMNGTAGDDVRYGLRRVLATPLLSFLAVLTLAFGVGATTAIFSVVDGVLLHPLPYAHAERLVTLNAGGRDGNWFSNSEPEYLDFRRLNDVLQGVAAYDWAEPILGDSAEPRRIETLLAAADLMPVLGVKPVLGRVFTREEDTRGAPRVAVISWSLWQQLFGGSSDAIGRTVRLNDRPVVVVGVMPRGFVFPDPEVQAWVPLQLDTVNPWARNNHHLEVVARLQAGVSVERAGARLDALAASSAKTYPEFYQQWGYRVRARTLRESVVGRVRGALLVLLGAVALVLAIACVNVANLLLARGEAKRRELAVRAALGARSGRLVRLTLAESGWLAAAGGGLGLLLAWLGVRALRELAPASIPRLEVIGINPVVLVFSSGLVLLTGLAFGTLPALGAARTDPAEAMKEGGTGRIGGRARQAGRRGLVVLQLALAVALVLGAGVLLRTLANLYGVDPGIQTDHVLTLRLTPPGARYQPPPELVGFYQQLLQRTAALPGVTAAAAISNLPLTQGISTWSLQIEGREAATVGEAPAADIEQITPDYFRVMGLQLVRGRAFNDRDGANSPFVVIISEAMAKALFPGEDPIGRRMRAFVPGSPWMEIVGIARDVRHYGLDRETRPVWYVPHAQGFRSAYTSFRSMTLVVKTTVAPAAVSAALQPAIHELERGVAIENSQSMEQVLSASLGTRHFTMLLLSVFAAVALFLAAVGVYGVIAWSVAARSREIGVRMALGARARQVVGGILGEAAVLAGIGLAGGLLLAALLSASLEGLVYGVRPMDPLTCVAVVVLLLGIALMAALAPALRAARVDPLHTLRME